MLAGWRPRGRLSPHVRPMRSARLCAQPPGPRHLLRRLPCATIASVTGSRDPLEGIERLLLDGNNLLHAMRRGGSTGPVPATALIGRLRAAIPPNVRVELVFDGPPDPGARNTRVASGVVVRYSGRFSADALLTRLVTEAAPFSIQEAATLLVVTDDGALKAELRRRGAATAGTSWLLRRLERTVVAAPSVGIGQRHSPAAPPARPSSDDERPGWRPGRGATTKHGNAKRRPRNVRDSDGR